MDAPDSGPRAVFDVFEAPPPPNFHEQVRAHVAATGQPETFPGLHRGPIDKDEEHIIMCIVSVPRTKRPDGDKAPCPMCQPNKFYEGRLVYFPGLKAAAVIGHECASGAVKGRANAEYRRRMDVERAQDFLIAELPKVAAELDRAEALAPAAGECQRVYGVLRREGGYFVKALRRASQGGGELIVSEQLGPALAGGPAGMRTSGSSVQTRDRRYGRLQGDAVVARTCTVEAGLTDATEALRTLAVADTEEAALDWVVTLTDDERIAAAAMLETAINGRAEAERSVEAFRLFFTARNLERVTDWGTHPENPTPMKAECVPYRREGSRLFGLRGPDNKQCKVVIDGALWGAAPEAEAA